MNAKNIARGKQPRRGGKRGITISNNLLAVLAVLFMITSILSTAVIYIDTEKYVKPETVKPSGLAVDSQANVQVTILPPPPMIYITIPYSCQSLRGTVMLNATVIDLNGNETITNVSFYYTHYTNEGIWYYIGSTYYDNDTVYNMSWDTTLGPDSIYYKIKVEAQDTKGMSSYSKTGYLAVTNTDVEPDWEAFKNTASTNLSLYSQWWNVTDLVLGNSAGYANFTGRTLNLNAVNLTRYISLSKSDFNLDSTPYPCMDGPVTLVFNNSEVSNPRVFKNGMPCPWGSCWILSNNYPDATVWVSEFGKYELSDNAILNIWDVTDANRTPGNQTRHRTESVGFYANLTAGIRAVNNSHVRCYIWFNTTPQPGLSMMNFTNLSLYSFNKSFEAPGRYAWNVTCNSTVDRFFDYRANDTVLIVNRPPFLKSMMPNITMEENSIAQYVSSLYDYFEDPDGDILAFNSTRPQNINVNIVGSRVVIMPDHNWWGNRTFRIQATDEWGLSAMSNLIWINVVHVVRPDEQNNGGGGAGGSDQEQQQEETQPLRCVDQWVCSAWSQCRFRWTFNSTNTSGLTQFPKSFENDGLRVRSCLDQNNCNHEWNRPNQTEYCFYVPRCDDLIRNGNETGVDCGGQCPSCGSCTNGRLDPGEEEADCGGICPSCGTCNDGVQNCHKGSCELGIDCGGPCPRVCAETEQPVPVINPLTWLLIGLMILALLFTTYLFVKPYIVKVYMWFLAMTNRERTQPEATLLEIETEYLLMLEKLRKGAEKGDPAKISSQLNGIFRRFLLKVFEVNTEATHEELIEIIRKSKVSGMLKLTLNAYLADMTQIEYSQAGITREKVIARIDRAKELLDLTVKSMPRPQAENAKKAGDSGKIAGPKPKPAAPARKGTLGDIYKLNLEAKRAITHGNLAEALAKRKEIGKVFKSLNKDNRLRVSSHISELDKELEMLKEGDNNED